MRWLVVLAMIVVLLGAYRTLGAPTASARRADRATEGTAPTPAPSPGAPRAHCRSGDPLANVYDPSRLTVLERCVVATGTVVFAQQQDDGDWHLAVLPDPASLRYLNRENLKKLYGTLVVEIVPADQSGCPTGQSPRPLDAWYGLGKCTGAAQVTPPLGAHVVVVGPLVRDEHHGWLEVHPAWYVQTDRVIGPVATAVVPVATAVGPIDDRD